jgi:uncharacterized membrane protein YkvA (DUF1232 family)
VSALSTWRRQARRLKTELYALYLAYRDPRVPWHARVVAACVVGYAFSPIDLIPDVVPVLGYLDDLILVPLGIVLALKLIPTPVMDECRERAKRAIEAGSSKPTNWGAAAVIVVLWVLLAGIAVFLTWRAVGVG